MSKKKHQGPKVLIVDIETSPLVVYTFGTFDQNIGNNQIIQDSKIISWSAKWHQDVHGHVNGPHNKVMYMDQRKNGPITDEDPKLLKGIWDLLDEADIVVGQNSKKFDIKRLNTAFLYAELGEPSSFKQMDTLQIAKSRFAFTSNKLEFTTDKLNKKYKKLSHGKFPGFSMWSECMKGNKEAWKEMEVYNKHDVLSTEEYFNTIQSWAHTGPNFSAYYDSYHHICRCGSIEFEKRGYFISAAGAKFQRLKCKTCGAEIRDGKNLTDKEKRDSLKKNTTR